MVAASILTSSHYLWSPVVGKNWGLPTYIICCTVFNNFIFGKWCRVQLKLFVKTCFFCSLLDCEDSCSQVTPSFVAVCSLILGYAVHIFHTTDAKYVSRQLMQITKRQHNPRCEASVEVSKTWWFSAKRNREADKQEKWEQAQVRLFSFQWQTALRKGRIRLACVSWFIFIRNVSPNANGRYWDRHS